MTASYKPEQASTVAPYLVVAGASHTIDFLKAIFGATEAYRVPGPGDLVMHAEVRIGESTLMLADANDRWPAVSAHVHIYVPDVDATYRRALEVGATSVQEPLKGHDPDKRGAVRDAGGTTWWIGTRVGE